ncbi:MAG: hypothetical protein JWO64_1494 [Hyphomicrobiales bacterium]|jgi:hypothetical protein|nr:hypothetical protein [Hyphomicrobiales bacterium]
MLGFLGFYIMAGVYIAAGVLGVSAIVAGVEKVMGVSPQRTDRLRH